ncbi:hemolysin [Alkalihalobacillus alcalophilus ATCC 27647 = CGMCC 1.3604]|uniref:Hemolysin n=1 Tax=Alkalihalobacillus alcalophilus ATCC 27647 = CGMCC 1.3604 TaxID=1218173 RepID=A0A094WIC2_ALKAL|nr:hemolysin III family protein [Alkalihalobacillus alcalophilus]KGA96576.1 hemolysin [Alkalihalobacillus alcalophilus ATCC 27647 = CGMCC 1.3604]MED1563518.1 hemolysin III family protein [Alkalihalobacillus alcalophilus]THG91363.1 hemolysin [Alkalihalobacillus alcalophilus ATCC 27647 = CGMCC 1.3604]
MSTYIREPINGLTHLVGAVLSFVALLAMVIKVTLTDPTVLNISAIIIFGISMILLYASSATYHMVMAKDHVIAFLRRLDHSMIFVLIAGSYTPFCLIALNGVTGWTIFGIVTTLAVLGVIFKMTWFNCPRWLSTALYIGMGWIIIFAFSPLADVLSTMGLFLLILGGVFYTIGGIIYALKPKQFEFKHFGFHEIFHIFIMLGTTAHFLSVFLYVI